jgi:hypothetical protein
MTQRVRWVAALSLVMLPSQSASAQKSVRALTTFFRYHGDTIWVERDSSSTRVVYSGDTVTKTASVNGAVRSISVYVVKNDLTTLLHYTNAAGVEQSGYFTGRKTPGTLLAFGDRTMLESALRTEASRAQRQELMQCSAAMGLALPSTEPPASPAQAITYPISLEVSIAQHLDTALYVRGCAAKGKLDTTPFVFRGEDSVRRIMPAPQRTFGPGMVATLLGTMQNSLVQQSLATRRSPAADELPVPENRCVPASPSNVVRRTGQRTLYVATTIMRYHGDTVWRETDSMAVRTIFHRDSVDRLFTINDTPRYSNSYVLEGDSAILIDATDSTGKHTTTGIGTRSPSLMLVTELRSIESQLGMAKLQGYLPTTANPIPRPASPEQPVTYAVSPFLTLVQHGDTLRYIRGCAARSPTDTTVFVFFGADSVKRMSPSRMFGIPMVASLVGQMNRPGILQAVSGRDAAFAGDLPRAQADPCAR